MIFYTIPYLFLLAFFTCGVNYKVKNYYLLFFGLLPAFLLVIFRANVGTDTVSYLQILDSIAISQGDVEASKEDLEFGFETLARCLLNLNLTSRFTLGVLSGLACILLLPAFARSREDAIVFVLLVFPVFFYDMTMNGLRYGIAFCLAKIAYDASERGEKICFSTAIFLAVSFHASSVLLLIILLARRISFKYLALGVAVSAMVVFFYYERLLFKFSAYEGLYSPSIFSGLAPLLIFLLVYIAVSLCSIRNLLYFSFLLLLEIIFFILAKFSYAGLRLQFLVLFALFCSLPSAAILYSRKRNVFLVMIFFVGLFGFATKSRNMIDDMGQGDSPFVPYRFVWEVK